MVMVVLIVVIVGCLIFSLFSFLINLPEHPSIMVVIGENTHQSLTRFNNYYSTKLNFESIEFNRIEMESTKLVRVN